MSFTHFEVIRNQCNRISVLLACGNLIITMNQAHNKYGDSTFSSSLISFLYHTLLAGNIRPPHLILNNRHLISLTDHALFHKLGRQAHDTALLLPLTLEIHLERHLARLLDSRLLARAVGDLAL